MLRRSLSSEAAASLITALTCAASVAGSLAPESNHSEASGVPPRSQASSRMMAADSSRLPIAALARVLAINIAAWSSAASGKSLARRPARNAARSPATLICPPLPNSNPVGTAELRQSQPCPPPLGRIKTAKIGRARSAIGDGRRACYRNPPRTDRRGVQPMSPVKGAAILLVTAPLVFAGGSVAAQTGVIQQNNVNISGGGASVTVSGQTVTVETTTGFAGHVVGDGEPASQTRPLPAVRSVDADGAFALTIRVGPQPSLVVATDRNLLPIVKTEVADGRLRLYTDRSYSVDGRIHITLTSPQIDAISASGSNEIDAQGLAGGNLTLSLNGSNNAMLAGNVASLSVEMSGSNRLAARSLAAGSAEVTLSGSGNAAVTAEQRLVATISGAGSLAVWGNPQERRTEVNGAGKVTFEQYIGRRASARRAGSRLPRLGDRRHQQAARIVGQRVELQQQRFGRFDRAAQRGDPDRVLVRFAGNPVIQRLGQAALARKHGQLDRCAGGNAGGGFGKTQRRRITAERINQTVGLGLGTGPHPALRHLFDGIGGHMSAGRDMGLEPLIGGVEQSFEPCACRR